LINNWTVHKSSPLVPSSRFFKLSVIFYIYITVDDRILIM
jgi:hypothetical protein